MIYIFYPSNMMGGAEYLLIKTANLLNNKNYDVGIIDFENGWVSKNVNNEKIVKVYFNGNKKIKLEDDDFLITTSNFMYKLDSYFEKSKAKILLWTVHPQNTILSFPTIIKRIPLSGRLQDKYLSYKQPMHKKNLESIIKKNGIVAMDGESNDTLFTKYKLKYSGFLPIFIYDSSFNNGFDRKIEVEYIRILWLGRIDLEFKIHILKKVLLDIDFLGKRSKEKFIFDIIGDGPGLKELRLFVKEKLSLNVSFLGEIPTEKLYDIIQKYDIGFAMGTSALDIAAKKIPTVLLDFSYSEVLKYNYRWIFETQKYTLGRHISSLSQQDIKSMNSIKDIISQLKSNKYHLSEKSYDYVCNNHSSESTFIRLKSCISTSEFTLEDVYGYRSTKPFWNSVHRLVFNFRK
ncbi:hypothetical protein ACTXLK_00785 [Psychrobacter faecalis]